jgi:biopolymer transport protein ExbB/TolQ
MKRLKIFKAYFVLWLFVYFIAISNIETFKLYFLSTLTFNIAIVSLLAIGTFMILKAAKDLTMIAGTFGVIMYKKGDISFYLKGIEKIFPSTIAQRIKERAQKKTLYFSQQEAEDILAWLEEKYSNQNKYNNFFIGTVLMIGLLGTFAGLLGSIASMGGIVSSLAGSNVDIGKIMAGFSVPLSSMAVGFGSSLFGVISAILLSVKGYLLNKAQESLLTGVENWLQARTIENSADEVISTTTLQSRQKSYMDIFVDQISSLKDQMREVADENREFQATFKSTIDQLKSDSKQERDVLWAIKESLSELATNNIESARSNQDLKRYLEALYALQKDSQEDLKRKDHILVSMISKQEKKDDMLKMGLFQVVDAIENMDKNISKRDRKLEKLLKIKNSTNEHNSGSKIEDIGDFMKNHIFHKDGE